MSDITFRKIKGRIVPIKKKTDYKGLAMGSAGAVTSLFVSNKVAHALSRFGTKAKIGGLLGTVFVGEALASEGFDRFNESLKLNKRTEQNVKNFTGGALGVLGAVSAIRPFTKFKKIPLKLIKGVF
jgi:hypothetical protein